MIYHALLPQEAARAPARGGLQPTPAGSRPIRRPLHPRRRRVDTMPAMTQAPSERIIPPSPRRNACSKSKRRRFSASSSTSTNPSSPPSRPSPRATAASSRWASASPASSARRSAPRSPRPALLRSSCIRPRPFMATWACSCAATSSLAISNSGETEELIRLLPSIKRVGAEIIAITGNPPSTLARGADHHLNAAISKEACPARTRTDRLDDRDARPRRRTGDGPPRAARLPEEDFAFLHPGGKLGKRFLRVHDLMHRGDEVPLVRESTDHARRDLRDVEEGLRHRRGRRTRPGDAAA